MKLTLPYRGKVYLSSPYGPRVLNGKEEFHRGVDLVGVESKDLLSPCDGVVAVSAIVTDKKDRTWEWGHFVRIDTADGYSVYLCHMAERAVWEGRTVLRGEVIGREGDSGYAFGSHCHLEVRKDGVSVDPCPFLGIENRGGVTVSGKEAEKTASNTPHAWGEEAVQWAIEEGILLGHDPEVKDYRLSEDITREEALVLLHRAWRRMNGRTI